MKPSVTRGRREDSKPVFSSLELLYWLLDLFGKLWIGAVSQVLHLSTPVFYLFCRSTESRVRVGEDAVSNPSTHTCSPGPMLYLVPSRSHTTDTSRP